MQNQTADLVFLGLSLVDFHLRSVIGSCLYESENILY